MGERVLDASSPPPTEFTDANQSPGVPHRDGEATFFRDGVTDWEEYDEISH